jgi:hypothetical protein
MDPEFREDGVCLECEAQPSNLHFPDPEVYYGIVASGNQVIRNQEQRDKLCDQLGACRLETDIWIDEQFPLPRDPGYF